MPSETSKQGEAEKAVADLLRALGQDPESERLKGTPRRVVDTFSKALRRPEPPVVSFVDAPESKTLITVSQIPFHSLCEHHLLPIFGTVDIGYLPGDQIVGVSLPVHVVNYFSLGLQLQERLTDEIADWLYEHLKARGVGVVTRAEHMCMSFRGIGDRTTSLQTSAFRGELKSLEQ